MAKYGTNDGTTQTKPSVDGYDIWQYTSVGKVDGITGNVDMNICYKDLPAEIRADTEPIQAFHARTENLCSCSREDIIFSICYAASTDPASKAISASKMARNHGTITKIVDALKAIKEDSSFTNRQSIAVRNGIIDYSGTAEQNNELLSLFKQGKLVK